MAKCAFLGLGVMGFPMAGHLLSAGHEVSVWNRTQATTQKWASAYPDGQAEAEISQAVEGADFVFICVGRDEDVYSVAKPAIAAMKAGAVLVDHTTTSADCAETVADWATAKDIAFMDAPISGGQAGAENGQLTIMCGAAPETFESVAPIMDAYAKRMTLIGPIGSGQRAKMMNQICIAGTLQGLSESIAFGKAAGLDIPTVIEAIGGGAAQSWQMDNRALTMDAGKYDYGFALDWMIKDLGYAIESADKVGVDMVIAKLVNGYYKELSESGDGRMDTSALLKRLHP
jgi:3-hydroxyisobutyrate dehydrogenase-like beta-hydroxyacid dehydrogenase